MPEVVARRRSPVVRVAQCVLIGGLAFQLLHFSEHAIQLGHWFLQPRERPWLSTGGTLLRDQLAINNAGVAVRNELLHLVGNLFFLSAVVAIVFLADRAGTASDRLAHRALVVQGVHFLEHLLLTVTVVATGIPYGASTFFGLVEGAGATSLRVWMHFLLNLGATWYAVLAAHGLHRADYLLPVSRVVEPRTRAHDPGSHRAAVRPGAEPGRGE